MKSILLFLIMSLCQFARAQDLQNVLVGVNNPAIPDSESFSICATAAATFQSFGDARQVVDHISLEPVGSYPSETLNVWFITRDSKGVREVYGLELKSLDSVEKWRAVAVNEEGLMYFATRASPQAILRDLQGQLVSQVDLSTCQITN